MSKKPPIDSIENIKIEDGVLIEYNVNAKVIITECHDKSDLGKKIIAAETEVKEII